MLLERLLQGLQVKVDYFALCKVSPDWRLSLPGSQGGAMVHFALQGHGQLLAADRSSRNDFSEHSMVVVPAGMAHALQSDPKPRHELRIADPPRPGEVANVVAGKESTARLVIACGRVQVAYVDSFDLFRGLRRPLTASILDFQGAARIFEDIVEQQRNPEPGHLALINALMYQGLVLFFRQLCEDGDCPFSWLAGLEDPRMARVLDHILCAPGQPHTVESLAGTAHMSRSAFAAHFSDVFAESPMRFVNRVRMQEAGKLLTHSELGIQQIASRLGHASRSHFSKSFNDHYGISPTEYRRHASEHRLESE